jgi:RNA ligase (TIGR02306 family)
MSTFKVEVVKIDEVNSHPNADRLDLLKIKDWQCVSAKGQFVAGDLAVYFPIDSILKPEIEARIFGIDSKVKLNNSRVRTIKLRGAFSQGLAVKLNVPLDPVDFSALRSHMLREGADWTDITGTKKFEPPVRLGAGSGTLSTNKKQTNPHFRKYTGIENAKNYPNVFEDGELVSVTEKIHGSNFRAGWVPFHADTFWKKVKQWTGFAPKWEFVYGSHNVQLQSKLLYKGYYDKNVYAEAVKKYDLEKKLEYGEVIYGEIYGDGIQKGYTYGCKPGERKCVFFDLMRNNEWLNPGDFEDFATLLGLPTVPDLYVGPFDKVKILALRDGDSVLAPTQKVREGVVVKPLKEETCYMGRKMLKYISDNYLLKNQDDESEAH